MTDTLQIGEPIPLGIIPKDDTPLVDAALQATGEAGGSDHEPVAGVSEQLAAMRAELGRISESVGLLIDGAATVTSQNIRSAGREAAAGLRNNPTLAIIGAATLGIGLAAMIVRSLVGDGRDWRR